MKAWQKTLVALGSVLTPGVAMAAETDTTTAPLWSLNDSAPVQHAAEAEVPSKISGVVGNTFATDYISRFVLLENQGFITQPYLELDFGLFEDKAGFFKKAYVFGGVWSSLHTNKEFAAGNLSGWYEFDWYGGIAADVEGGFNLNLQYVEFTSPSNSFGTAKNIQFVVSFDDSPYLEKFALHPYAQIFFETSGKAGTGDDEGIYLELGINPGFTLMEESQMPLTISFPIAIGLGFDEFYHDNDTLGGVRVGASLGVPLAFANGKGYGEWSANATASYYFFGDGVKDANSAAGGNDPDGELAGTVDIKCAF